MQISQLYVDNFRSFSDTYIPILDMNFLVGENSSGKTSILKLISLLSSQKFWLEGAFRNADVDYSYYGDITDEALRKMTTIAMLLEDVEKKKEPSIAIRFSIHKNSQGQSTIIEVRFQANGFDFSIKPAGDVDKLNFWMDRVASEVWSFEKWVKSPAPNTASYEELTSEYPQFVGNVSRSPFFMISEVTSRAEKKYKTSSRLIHPYWFFTDEYKWIAPIRVKPQNTYDENIYEYSAEGAHVPFLLKTLLSKGQNSQNILKTLNAFGEESGLYDTVAVKEYELSGNSPFSVEVIMSKHGRRLTNVGYGVSQVLPVVVELLNSRGVNIAIQQPEVHLHPRAQAGLGSLLFDVARSNKIRCTIETHSDYIIDRYRQEMAKAKGATPTAQVLFFERKNKVNVVHPIRIQSNGKYGEEQPDSFREFFYKEELKNIAI